MLNAAAKSYTIVLPDKTYEVPFYRHHIYQNGFAQRYIRLGNILPIQYRTMGLVHNAEATLFDAAAVWKTGVEIMQKDPTYFVERI